MRHFYTLLLLIVTASCSTRYKEFYPDGQVAVDLRLGGDHGIIRDEIREGKTRDSITGLISGNSDRADDILLEAKEATDPSRITAGGVVGAGLVIEGTIDHTSQAAANGHNSEKIVDRLARMATWMYGFATWSKIETGKQAADVSKSQSVDGVKMNDSNNSLEGLKSDNATSVELEALTLE
tara:strand:+ start:2965 stop:3507 length:543 start_codon:yes stop_codon:yes gene_type:complete